MDDSDSFYVACELGQTSVIDLMLTKDDSDVDVNLRSADGSTPLLIASKRGHVNTVRRLLMVKGIDVNVHWVGHTPQCTPLMLAAEHGDETLVTRLLQLRARIDARDEQGRTALYCAVRHDQVAVVSRLLDARASPNIRRAPDNSTPFLLAAEHGFVRMLAALKDAGAATTATLTDGSDALLLAVQNSHIEAVQRLLAWRGGPSVVSRSLLGIATARGHVGVLQLLLASESSDSPLEDVSSQQEAQKLQSMGLPPGPGDVVAASATEASQLRGKGNDLFNRGHFDAALIAFSRASELSVCHLAPSNAAQAALELGDYEQALQFATLAFRRDRTHTKTWFRYVKALSFLRRASEALVWVADRAFDDSSGISTETRSELVQAIAESSPYLDAVHPGVCLQRVEAGYRVVALQPIKVHAKISSELAVVPWSWLDVSRPERIERFVTTVTREQVQMVTGVHPRSYEHVPKVEVEPLRSLRPQIAEMLPRATAQDIDECIRLLGIAQLSSHDDGIHQFGSFINHSCAFNAELRGKNHLAIFACRDILVGEEICIPYLGSGLLNAHVNIRRLSFRKGWGLECWCPRCKEELQLDDERIAQGGEEIDEAHFLEFQSRQAKLLKAEKDLLLGADFNNSSATSWQAWEEVWLLTQYIDRLDHYVQSKPARLSLQAGRDIVFALEAAGALERVSRLLHLQLAYLPVYTMNLHAVRSTLLSVLQIYEHAQCTSKVQGFCDVTEIRSSIQALALILKQTDSV
jgi:tetratricopeptide (TPR) repeat protein